MSCVLEPKMKAVGNNYSRLSRILLHQYHKA